MDTEYAVINLPGKGNYAVTLPGQISFILDANKEEFQTTFEEILRDYVPEETTVYESRASIAVIPTYDCNLRCGYCYARGGEYKEKIQLNQFQKILEYKKQEFSNTRWLDLYLVGGGEPLLYFSLVKELHEMAKHFFNEIQVHVVTNGTFDEEVREWLVKEKADVRISYDGVAHTLQRPYKEGKSSTNDVENTIKSLVQEGIQPIIQTIVTSTSENQMIESALRCIDMGVRIIKIEPALSSEISRGGIAIEPNPVSYAKQLLKLIKYIAKENLPLQIDTGFFTKPATESYCGMAKGNFTLTPDGLITSCVEVARKSDPYANHVKIGGFDGDILTLSEENRNWLNQLNYKNQLGGCRSCPLRMICLGGCPMANIWRNGLPLTKSAFTCVLEHEFLPELLLSMANDPIIMNVVMENTFLV